MTDIIVLKYLKENLKKKCRKNGMNSKEVTIIFLLKSASQFKKVNRNAIKITKLAIIAVNKFLKF
jgi:hypothetical protein